MYVSTQNAQKILEMRVEKHRKCWDGFFVFIEKFLGNCSSTRHTAAEWEHFKHGGSHQGKPLLQMNESII